MAWNLLTSKTSKYKRGEKLRACSGIKYAKDNIKQSKINEHETPLDEILYGQFSAGETMDKHLEEKTLLGWIELIENQKLYKAVKGLSIEDQIFISYIVKKGLTQQELEEIYKVSHRAIGQKYQRLIKKIKKFI